MPVVLGEDVTADANGDWDSDRVSNVDEFYAGDNPCEFDERTLAQARALISNDVDTTTTPCPEFSFDDVLADPDGDWDLDLATNSFELYNDSNPCTYDASVNADFEPEILTGSPCPDFTVDDVTADPDGDWDRDDKTNIAEFYDNDNPCLYEGNITFATATPTPEPTPAATSEPTSTPEATATPAATSEPTSTPEATATPAATSEPTSTPEPEATPEPASTSEPEATAEPTSTPEPDATLEPDATPEPASTSEPEATAEPTSTPEPDATLEPEATAEPTSTPEPDATSQPPNTPPDTDASDRTDTNPWEVGPVSSGALTIDNETVSFGSETRLLSEVTSVTVLGTSGRDQISIVVDSPPDELPPITLRLGAGHDRIDAVSPATDEGAVANGVLTIGGVAIAMLGVDEIVGEVGTLFGTPAIVAFSRTGSSVAASSASDEALDATLRHDAETDEFELITRNDDGERSESFRFDDQITTFAIRGSDYDDVLKLDFSVPLVSMTVSFDGGAGFDSLLGSGADTTWNLVSDGTGDVNGVEFTRIERLVGAADNEDQFVVAADGALEGELDGGDGGFDTIVLEGEFVSVEHRPTAPDSGAIVLDSKTLHYVGLEPVIDNTVVADRVVFGSGSDDDATFSTDLATGQQVLSAATFEDITFAVLPTESLTIDLGDGTDLLMVDSVSLPGIDVTLIAETVNVLEDATVSTRADGSDSGDIAISGEVINLAPNSSILADVEPGGTGSAGNVTLHADKSPSLGLSLAGDILSPVLIADNSATVTATGAAIAGADVVIKATSATQTRWDDLGDYWDSITGSLLAGLGEFPQLALSALSPITGQVKIQHAASAVTLADTTIVASGSASVASASEADASFSAVGIDSQIVKQFVVVVGYGEATADSTVDLVGTTSIVAQDDISVSSDATTEAEVGAGITANGALGNGSDVELAVSVAIYRSNEQSHTTVASGARLESLTGNIDIAAAGSSTNKVGADVVVFQDGSGGGAFAISIDNADIVARVDGTVIASSPLNHPAMLVDVAGAVVDGWITLTGIAEPDALTRNTKLVYDSQGGTSIPGLVDGETYIVADVETTVEADGMLTQRIRLAEGSTIGLDAAQTDPDASHALAQQGVVTFDAALSVAEVGGSLTIAPLTGIEIGDVIRYVGPSGSNTLGDINAVFDAAARTATVTSGPAWDLLALYPGMEIEFAGTTANDHRFRIDGFSADGRTMVLSPLDGEALETEPTANGFEIQTQPTPAELITSLVQGDSYEVVGLGARLALRDQTTGALVAFETTGSGIHGFAHEVRRVDFSPTDAVDADRDTIFAPGHGLQTGDWVLYSTDPTIANTGIVTAFFDGEDGVDGGTTNIPDAPIDGIGNGNGYYVTRVDDDHIRLTAGSYAAVRAEMLALGAGMGEQGFAVVGKGHGVSITASLESTDYVSAGVELTDDTESAFSVGEGIISGSAVSIAGGAQGLIEQLQMMPCQGPATSAGAPATCDQNTPEGGLAVDIAVTLALGLADHEVEAVVGSTAVIESGADLVVDASIEQLLQIAPISEATRNAVGAADDSGFAGRQGDVEFGIAVGVAVVNNRAIATVDDGATVDAAGATTVSASVTYPLLIDSVDGAVNPAVTVMEEGLDGLAFALDGTLGFSSNLFNVETSALSGDSDNPDADKLAVSGSGVFLGLDNDATATIGAGAQINQKVGYQTSTQSVAVTADIAMELVEVAHNSSFNLSVPDIAEAGVDAFKDKDLATFFKGLANPFGASGQTAIGPAILVNTTDNLATATIEEAADGTPTRVRTGTVGDGLTVRATSDIFNVAVAQTGAKSSDLGITASVTVADFKNHARAEIGDNVLVTGGAVLVEAVDTIDRIAVAGAWTASEKIGVGVSVGVNLVERSAIAEADGAISTTGAVAVSAQSNGDLFALVIGGATPPVNKSEDEPAGQPPTQPVPDRNDLSLALALSAAVNQVAHTTSATLLSDNVIAGSVAVTALTDVDVHAIVIAAAFSGEKPDNSNRPIGGSQIDLAGAGAVAVNKVAGATTARIATANVTTNGVDGVTVMATDTSSIRADGGGVAVSVSLAGKASGGKTKATTASIGASVAINDISSEVTAAIDDSIVVGVSDAKVQAIARPRIDALTIAAAVSVSQSQGTSISLSGAGAGSGNTIVSTVAARVARSQIDVDRAVEVSAEDTSAIRADAGGVAIAIAIGNKAKGVSVGLSVALNTITSTTSATIDTATLTAGAAAPGTTDAVVVSAISTPNIGALTIGGAAGPNAGAGAGSGNAIISSVRSLVTNSTVLAPSGGNIRLVAVDDSTINADAGGLAFSFAQQGQSNSTATFSVGVSIAINTINSVVVATVVNSRLTADNVIVSATGSPTIDALTIAAAAAVAKGGQGTSIAFAGAGTGSGNEITSRVEAEINESTVDATNDVEVDATNTSAITANAVGASVSVNLSGQGRGATVALGLALALNTITATTSANITGGSTTAGSGISIRANGDARVLATTVGIAISATIGNGQSITGSGAGAGSGNEIASSVKAWTTRASLTAGGEVLVVATDSSAITATSVAGSVAVQGGGRGASIALGVAASTNTISGVNGRPRAEATINGSSVSAGSIEVRAEGTGAITATSIAASVAVAVGNLSVAISGAGAAAVNTMAGPVRASLKDSVVMTAGSVTVKSRSRMAIDAKIFAVAVSVAAGGGSGGSVAVGASIARNNIGFDADGVRMPAAAIAEIVRSEVLGAASVLVKATATNTVEALVIAGSVAVAATSQNAFGLTGSGSDAVNRIAAGAQARVRGAGSNLVVGGLRVLALDISTINADVGTASVAVAVGGQLAVALAIGVGLASNEIASHVVAQIIDSQVQATSVIVDAERRATITTVAVAASVSVAVSKTAVGLSGAGAAATNTVNGSVQALIRNSTVETLGSVRVEAEQSGVIRATIVAATAAVGVGGLGVGVSIGASLARNLVGYSSPNVRVGLPVSAVIEDSTITAGGSVDVLATTVSVIDASVVAASVAVAAGGKGAIAASGAGASALNQTATDVEASISGSSSVTGSVVIVRAADRSNVDSEVVAVSIAASFAPKLSLSISIGVALADNTIRNSVTASVSGAAVTSAGNIVVEAIETATIDSVSAAAALAAAISLAGISLSGGAATSSNLVENQITSLVSDGAALRAAGLVSVTSTDTARVDAELKSAAISISVVNVAIGLSLSDVTVNDIVSSSVLDSEIIADGGAVTVKSTANPTALSDGLVGAISVGIGAGAAVAIARISIGGATSVAVENSTLRAAGGTIEVTATTTSNAAPKVTAGSFGAIAANVMEATTEIGGETTASLAGDVTFEAQQVNVLANDLSVAGPALTVVSAGVITVSVSNSTATIDRSTMATVEPRTKIVVEDGSFSLAATSNSIVRTNITGATAGVINVTVAGNVLSTVETMTETMIGRLSVLDVAGAAVVRARGRSVASTNVHVDSGGAIDVRILNATAIVTSSTETDVATGVSITAGGELAISASNSGSVAARVGGIGVGIVVSVRFANANVSWNGTATTLIGAESRLTGSTVDVRTDSRNTGASASASNEGGGVVSVGSSGSETTADNAAVVQVGDDVQISASDGIDIVSSAFTRALTFGGTDGGGFADFPRGNATTTTVTSSTIDIGDRAIIVTGGRLRVEARNGGDANADAAASGGGVGVGADTNATTTATFVTSTEIGTGANLDGDVAVVRARADLDVAGSTTTTASGLGVTARAKTNVTTTSDVSIDLAEESFVRGSRLVEIDASHESIDTRATSSATAKALGAGTESRATNTLTTTTTVTAQALAAVAGRDILIAARTPVLPGQSAKATRSGTPLDSPVVVSTKTLGYVRTIDWNADIIVLGAEAPLLEIGPDGEVLRQVNVSFTETPTAIVVDAIGTSIATGGRIRFFIPKSTFDGLSAVQAEVFGYGTINAVAKLMGAPAIEFRTGLERVDIFNRSAKNLVVNGIDVIDVTPQVTQSIVLDVPDEVGFTPTTSTDPGATPVSVINAGLGDLIVQGPIDTPFGTVMLSAELGDVIKGGLASIRSTALGMSAVTGSIGSLDNPFQVDSGLVAARAANGAHITHTTGDLTLGRVRSPLSLFAKDLDLSGVTSDSGQVVLEARGSIVIGDPAGTIEAAAPQLVLRALTGSVGTTAAPLRIDGSANRDALIASGPTGIHVIDIVGSLRPGVVTATTGDITIGVAEGPIDGPDAGDQDLVLRGDSRILTLGSTIRLFAGDDVLARAGSSVVARGADGLIVIEADLDSNDQGLGASIDLRGLLDAPTVQVSSGIDGDEITLVTTAAGSSTTVDSGEGSDTITIGDGSLAAIDGDVTVDGGVDDVLDTLIFDAAASPFALSGVVGDVAVSGFELGSPVFYENLTKIEVRTGSGNDVAHVESTLEGTTVTLDLASGDDDVVVSGDDGTVNNVSGLVEVLGGGGRDSLIIDDSSDTGANTGGLTFEQVTGLDMGGVNDGVAYVDVEALTVSLGGGDDTFTIESSSFGTTTTIDGGTGDDAITVGPTPADINGDVEVVGGDSADSLTVSTPAKRSVLLVDVDARGRGTVMSAGADGPSALLRPWGRPVYRSKHRGRRTQDLRYRIDGDHQHRCRR